VAPNTGGARTGSVTIAGRSFTVTQASGCTYSINPARASFDKKRQEGTVTVTAGAGCAWTAAVVSGSSWISIVSGTSGTGNGSVRFRIEKNDDDDDDRSGSLLIAGHTFTIRQEGDDD
jgi:hypothetical protein